MTIHYCKLNQAVAPIAAAMLDVMVLLQQIQKASCPSHVVINLKKVLIFNPIRKENQTFL